jgi:peptidyl-tRNA hydrolase, PTH1 family
MKYLIAGLGNIGPEYVHTRHNIGFDVLDKLAALREVPFAPDRYADHASFRYRGRHFHLIKPSTYMNLSGKAVRYWMQQLKVELPNLLVVLDDIALPTGKLRLRGQGSDGGHNGLKSIDELLGSNQYARLRIGIGGEFPKGRQSDYVLGRWSDDEWDIIAPKLASAADLILSFGTEGLANTMTRFNNL